MSSDQTENDPTIEAWVRGWRTCREVALGALHEWPAIQAIVRSRLDGDAPRPPQCAPCLVPGCADEHAGEYPLCPAHLHTLVEMANGRAARPVGCGRCGNPIAECICAVAGHQPLEIEDPCPRCKSEPIEPGYTICRSCSEAEANDAIDEGPIRTVARGREPLIVEVPTVLSRIQTQLDAFDGPITTPCDRCGADVSIGPRAKDGTPPGDLLCGNCAAPEIRRVDNEGSNG